MPLVASQNVVNVVARGGDAKAAIELLRRELATEPREVRIVSISVKDVPSMGGSLGTSLTAVIELVSPAH